MASMMELPSPSMREDRTKRSSEARIRGHVLAEAEEIDDVLDAQLVGLLVELHPERALADDDDLDSGGVVLEDLRRLDEVPVPLVVLELGHDPDEVIVRGEAEFPAEEVPFLDLPEGGEIDARRDDLDEPLRDPALDQDLPDLFGDGDDGVDRS